MDDNDEVVSIKSTSRKSQDSPRPRVLSLAEGPGAVGSVPAWGLVGGQPSVQMISSTHRSLHL